MTFVYLGLELVATALLLCGPIIAVLVFAPLTPSERDLLGMPPARKRTTP